MLMHVTSTNLFFIFFLNNYSLSLKEYMYSIVYFTCLLPLESQCHTAAHLIPFINHADFANCRALAHRETVKENNLNTL